MSDYFTPADLPFRSLAELYHLHACLQRDLAQTPTDSTAYGQLLADLHAVQRMIHCKMAMQPRF